MRLSLPHPTHVPCYLLKVHRAHLATLIFVDRGKVLDDSLNPCSRLVDNSLPHFSLARSDATEAVKDPSHPLLHPYFIPSYSTHPFLYLLIPSSTLPFPTTSPTLTSPLLLHPLILYSTLSSPTLPFPLLLHPDLLYSTLSSPIPSPTPPSPIPRSHPLFHPLLHPSFPPLYPPLPYSLPSSLIPSPHPLLYRLLPYSALPSSPPLPQTLYFTHLSLNSYFLSLH